MRLWPGRGGREDELRAELEAVPEVGFDPNDGFHDHFFMRRIRYREVPSEWKARPVPARWKQRTLEESWNETAGRQPLPKNLEDDELTTGKE